MSEPSLKDDSTSFILPNDQTFTRLHCQYEFRSLTEDEMLYVYNFCKACWNGYLITLCQCSPESPGIYSLLHRVFLAESVEELRNKALEENISKDDFQAFLVYTCGFIANAGNYKGIALTKIIPNLPQEVFVQIIELSKAYAKDDEKMKTLLEVVGSIYALGEEYNVLGLPPNGVTTYWNNNFNKKNISDTLQFMLKYRVDPTNCRVYKYKYESFISFNIQIASVNAYNMEGQTMRNKAFKTVQFDITRGAYSKLLERINENLTEAKIFAPDDCQRKRIELYMKSFREGQIGYHKQGTRLWLKEENATVESYVGFSTLYRDPLGQFAQFFGFVGIVNKELSIKYHYIMHFAADILKFLPWPEEFENDDFAMLDYKIIDVISYASSRWQPAVTIPNYEAMRVKKGSKNFMFRNVLVKYVLKETYRYLNAIDNKLVFDYIIKATEVLTCLHELFGRSSGKLFRLDKQCFFNFDCKNLKNPLNNCPIVTWYTYFDTYESKFTDIALPYEEFRAMSVALYLSLERKILTLFGHMNPRDQNNIAYVIWLFVIWRAVNDSLTMYHVPTKRWMDSRSQARYGIFQILLQAEIVTILPTETDPETDNNNNSNNNNNAYILTLDRTKFDTVGKTALGDVLIKMQVYKSTGNVEEARKLLSMYTDVTETGDWLTWREKILINREPDSLIVQPNVSYENGRVVFLTYENSCEGYLKSWLERFPSDDVDDILEEITKQHTAEMKKQVYF